MDGWMYGVCMDIWMYGYIDVWTYGCMDGCMEFPSAFTVKKKFFRRHI